MTTEHVHSAECRCYYGGCVAWWRHWHGFLPGGCDDPADPDGIPRIFDHDDPEPGALRDLNGDILREAIR